MKKYLLPLVAVLALATTSCKDKNKQDHQGTTFTQPETNQQTQTAPPPQISADTDLQNNLSTATKDFPGVAYTVNNGEVTLTGNITRDRLPKLMQSVQALHPKKVNNQLTIK